MDKYLNANMIFSKFSHNYMELNSDLPIRPSEMGVLNIIVKRDGLFTPLMLAEMLEVSKPMITMHILKLEKQGYVTRQKSQEDKRSFFVLPTDKARELVKKTVEKMNENLMELEKFLGVDDFEKLIGLLGKANQKIKEIL